MSLASVRWKSRRRFQLLSKFSTDLPPMILHEAAVLAAAVLEAVDEMGAEFRLENMRQD